MKALTLILLACIILLQPLSKLVMVAEYQVNKNYIATFLCENKNKPQLKCEGKCHLSKELKAAAAQEKKAPTQLKEKLETLYFYQATPTFSFQFPAIFRTEFPLYFSSNPLHPVFGIFHPPQYVV